MRLISAATSLAAILAFSLAAPAAAETLLDAHGELTDSDSRAENSPYDEHVVILTAGGRYRINASSEAFDTIVEVRRAGVAEPLGRNDDYGEGLNSQLNFTPDQTGEYQIRVVAFSDTGRGAYSVKVETMPPLPPPSTARPNGRQRVTWRYWDGELSETDGDQDGKRYDDYLVHFTAGQTHMIAVDGDGFDALVQVLRANEREGTPVDMDDDAGPGFNALLGLRVEETGDYVVRVTSYQTGQSGRYRLRIGE